MSKLSKSIMNIALLNALTTLSLYNEPHIKPSSRSMSDTVEQPKGYDHRVRTDEEKARKKVHKAKLKARRAKRSKTRR